MPTKSAPRPRIGIGVIILNPAGQILSRKAISCYLEEKFYRQG